MDSVSDSAVVTESESQLPVPDVWRGAIRAIVDSFIRGDFSPVLTDLIRMRPLSDELKDFIRDIVADYGETLAILSDDTWLSSIYMWMGDFWEVYVDLWTEESGRSDMVLFLRFHESTCGYEVQVLSVHVP